MDARVLLRASEVAAMFGVNAKTVTRWAKSGKLPCVYTLGGHRRYDRDMIVALTLMCRSDSTSD